ncbi:MAG: hypothetical protein WD969_00105 [Paracoccaceae bacterium]
MREIDGFQQLCAGLGRLKSDLRIAVVYNGDKTAPGAVIRPGHNPRSEKSYRPVAEDIAAGLEAAGFQNVSLLPDDLTLPERLREGRIDLAWLNTAGVQGYDAIAHAPAMMELAGVPYIGHRPLLALTLDSKQVFKRECQALGLPTPSFMVWDGVRGRLDPMSDPQFRAAFKGRSGGYVVKPVIGRASQNVHFIPDVDGVADAVEAVYRETLNQVLIEAYMGGAEYCVAVSGPVVVKAGAPERRAAPFAFSIVERVIEPGEAIFTSMDLRPITEARAHAIGPDHPAYHRLADLAQRVHSDFQLRCLVRIDIRADDDGTLFILEANPKPDLKRPGGGATSLICVGLPAEGMSYEDLLLSLLLDRLDHYLRHRPAVVRHIADLLA